MKQSSKVLLIFFILAGTALRLYQIGFQCFWLEEIFTLQMIQNNVPRIIIDSVSTDFNPPVYYIAAKISAMVFGDVGIRIVSAVAGILLIPAMYLLGKEYKDELTGMFCSGTCSVLFPLVYYSQYGRAYSLSLLLFVVALIFYIRVSREQDDYEEIIFWVLIGVNAWIHLFSLIPLGLLGLDLLRRNFEERVKFALVPISICIPLVVSIISIITTRATSAGVNYGYSPIMILLMTPGEFFNVLFVWVGILVVVALWLPDGDSLKWRLVDVVVITIATGVFLSQYTPFFPRYYMTVSLILILLAASALSYFVEFSKNYLPVIENETYAVAALVVCIVILFLALQSPDYLVYYTTQKYTCG